MISTIKEEAANEYLNYLHITFFAIFIIGRRRWRFLWENAKKYRHFMKYK